MVKIPQLMVVEPSAEQSKHRAAGMFVRKEPRVDVEVLKHQLREVREYCRSNSESLINRLRASMEQYQNVRMTSVKTGKEAASVINGIADDTRIGSVNKSNVVVNEIRPYLRDAGLQTYLRYFTEFNNFEKERFTKKVEDYWSLPGTHGRGLVESFGTRRTISAMDGEKARNYVAILGVNAVSAEDGSIFFLQHMSNISRDLEEAKKVVLVVTPDKILKDVNDAILHTRAMGIFGLESILLDLEPHPVEQFDFESLPIISENPEREVHVVLLDNGRSELARGTYADLFLCIDCRACARQCPIGKHTMIDKGMVYSPKNYLFASLQGILPSPDNCLHCGRCHVECPVDIDIPAYMWNFLCHHYEEHGRSVKKRMLDDPEILAKLGTLAAPLSNWMVTLPPVKFLTELFAGIHHRSHLPMFHRQTFRNWFQGGRRG